MTSDQKPTRHYPALDGVRGVAALSVVLFHLERWLGEPGLATNGNLSVDMFFTLSGFVLAVAYSRRIHSMSLWEFLLKRAIRFMPIIVLATVISSSYLLSKAISRTDEILYSTLLLAFLTGALNLPFFGAPSNIGGPQLFPLNGPQFSLFFEVVANGVWWAVRFGPQVFIAVATFLLSASCVIVYGIGGDTTATFWLGFAHVGSSFSLGVLVYHLNEALAPKKRHALSALFWCLALLMLGLFCIQVEAPFSIKLLWKFAFAPALVWTGSSVDLSATQTRLCRYLGDLSYPIYALHYPIFCWVNGVIQAFTGGKNPTLETLVVVFAVLAASHLFFQLYDKPVRSYLDRRVGGRRSTNSATPSGS